MIKIILFIIYTLLNSISYGQNYGSWTETDSLNIARVWHAMVVLPNGNVLISGNDIDSIQSSCEIYEMSTGKWRYTTPMNIPRTLHNLVLLNSGKILAVGGYKEQSCELFDPVTETWAMTDSIPTFRYWGQTVTTLGDGKILVAGGAYIDTVLWDVVYLDNLDIYDPNTDKWSIGAPMKISRDWHTATLLNDGRMFISGGYNDSLEINECEIYDPQNNTWVTVSPMIEIRHTHAAILLNNGNVFVSGGGILLPGSKSCEVFNVDENQWSSVADMWEYRSRHSIYYLAEINKLLILGGDQLPPTYADTWEIYDPDKLLPVYMESFPINQELIYNNIKLLNGSIFVAGNDEYIIPFFWASKRSWIFDVTTDVTESNSKIKDFGLEQNYPNPFNPTTTISYTLQSYVNVELKVYDVLGNEMNTLVNKSQPSGTYHINFDASEYASGVYFYKLQVESYNKTKKMIYLK